MMNRLDLPLLAATETARAHGVEPDRCVVLQDGHTLVLRLTESLVARVLTDPDGPRRGKEWFVRENAVAAHLTARRAPVIPLHPDLPAGPHEHGGLTLNFWKFVESVPEPIPHSAAGATLRRCHECLADFPVPLPRLAILTEALEMLDLLESRGLFPASTLDLLRDRLTESISVLTDFPYQPLHGDAHPGNMINTTSGLLWTDWEDAFSGPVEWDVASLIWNAKLLDGDEDSAREMIEGYESGVGAAGGLGSGLSPVSGVGKVNGEPDRRVLDRVVLDRKALEQCLIARAAVMSAWYPILYPRPDAARREKLEMRLRWLEGKRISQGLDWRGIG